MVEEAKSSQSKSGVKRPVAPEPPARLQIGRPAVAPHHFYNASGMMGTLARFDSPDMPSLQKLTAAIQLVMTEDILIRIPTSTPKVSDAILATILQQCFDLLKDESQKERDRRKKKKQQEAEEAEKEKPDSQSEEKAKELLQTLLSHAEEQKENMGDFCKWARASVAQTQAMMKKNLGVLPDHTQKSFKILNDAIEALEHGMTPDYIMNRLESVIELKNES